MTIVRRCTTILLGLLFVASRAQGEKWVNYTIDDQLGDESTGRLVTYSPPGVWSQGNGCDFCALKPDNKSAFDGTWHDGFHDPSRDVEPLAFEFKFNGTAFWIFNILVKLALTNVNITLDGELIDTYSHTPNLTQGFSYNNSIFSREDIPYGEHTVGVSAFGPNQTNVLFDYAIYTTNITDDVPSTNGTGSAPSNGNTSHSHDIAGPVAGGVVGGVVFILLLIVGLWWYRRRFRGRKAQSVAPFISKGRQPFDGMLETSEEKAIGIGAAYVPSSLRIDNAGTDTIPLTGRSDDTSGSTASSPTSRDDAYYTDIEELRDQLASLVRSSRATSITGTPATSTYQSSQPQTCETKLSREHGSYIENEIRSLRQEVEQLRAQQEARSVPSAPSPTPTNIRAGGVSLNLAQEIASLRSEMEELRMQQEIFAGPLPDYSPPEGPLPGFTNVGVVEHV